jgi:hypothetical protein
METNKKADNSEAIRLYKYFGSFDKDGLSFVPLRSCIQVLKEKNGDFEAAKKALVDRYAVK